MACTGVCRWAPALSAAAESTGRNLLSAAAESTVSAETESTVSAQTESTGRNLLPRRLPQTRAAQLHRLASSSSSWLLRRGAASPPHQVCASPSRSARALAQICCARRARGIAAGRRRRDCVSPSSAWRIPPPTPLDPPSSETDMPRPSSRQRIHRLWSVRDLGGSKRLRSQG